MQIKRDTKGLYSVTCNGREWSIDDTGNQSDHGSWRWHVYEYGKNSDGYFTGTYKEAKEIIQKYSI
jgi:hypothetical protein